MSDDAKQSGRQLAFNIVNKINAIKEKQNKPPPPPSKPPVIETSPLVEAIKALAGNKVDITPIVEALEAAQTETLDIKPIVEAINDIELKFDVDLSAVAQQIEAVAKRPPTDTKVIKDLVSAMDRNTKVLSELVEVARSAKVIEYDNLGRITEIKLK